MNIKNLWWKHLLLIIKYLLPRNSYVSSIWSLIFDTNETQICSAGTLILSLSYYLFLFSLLPSTCIYCTCQVTSAALYSFKYPFTLFHAKMRYKNCLLCLWSAFGKNFHGCYFSCVWYISSATRACLPIGWKICKLEANQWNTITFQVRHQQQANQLLSWAKYTLPLIIVDKNKPLTSKSQLMFALSLL